MINIKRKLIKLIAISIILIFCIASITSASENHVPNKKLKHITYNIWTSTIWSGYAVDTNIGSVTDVKGSWTVPEVEPLPLKKDQYACFWIGIDGDISSTVEQIGTDCTVVKGVPVYTAWYEFYPLNPVDIPMTIKPGDRISAEVKYDTTQKIFILSITNENTQETFTTTSAGYSKINSAKRNSAEWIVESLSGMPLANFYQVNFYNNYATIDGTEYNLGLIETETTYTADQINMVTNKNQPMATSTTLQPDGNFIVNWNSAGR
jgi:hypothetical protein